MIRSLPAIYIITSRRVTNIFKRSSPYFPFCLHVSSYTLHVSNTFKRGKQEARSRYLHETREFIDLPFQWPFHRFDSINPDTLHPEWHVLASTCHLDIISSCFVASEASNLLDSSYRPPFFNLRRKSQIFEEEALKVERKMIRQSSGSQPLWYVFYRLGVRENNIDNGGKLNRNTKTKVVECRFTKRDSRCFNAVFVCSDCSRLGQAIAKKLKRIGKCKIKSKSLQASLG